MAEEGGSDRKSTFRWLMKAVRYAVVSMVAVLIGAVIINAVVLLLQPDLMSLSVSRGALLARRAQGHPPEVTLDFQLNFRNPSAGARTRIMYLVNTSVYIFDKNTLASTLRPTRSCVVRFKIRDNTVPQKSLGLNYFSARVHATNYSTRPYFFKELYYKGLNISGVTMRVDGRIINELWSAFNTTPRAMTYNCQPLVISFMDRHDKDFRKMPDVPCAAAVPPQS